VEIATTDLHVALDAEAFGIRCHDLTDHLSCEIIEAHRQQAWSLSRTWSSPYWKDVTHHGIDLPEVARNFMYMAFATMLNATHAWQSVLSTTGAQRIVACNSRNIPVDWSYRAHTDVPLAVLAALADDAGLDMMWLPEPASDATALVRAVPSKSAAAYESTGGGQARRVVMLGGGRDYTDQKRLVKGLCDQTGWSVTHIDIGSSMGLASRVEGAPWQVLLSLPLDDQSVADQVADGWVRFTANLSESDLPELFRHRALWFQFACYRDYLLTLAHVVQATDLVLDTSTYDGLIVSNDIDSLRAAVVTASARGVPTIELIHGGIAHLEVYDFATDQIIVWGEAHRRQMISLDRDAGRVVLGGNFNYRDKQLTTEEKAARRSELCMQLGRSVTSRIVLLLTSQPYVDLTLPVACMSRYRATWDALLKCAEHHPEVALVAKPHPAFDDPTFYERLNEGRAASIHVLDSQLDLLALLPLCDLAVLVDSPSTAGLEAMLLGVPLLFIRHSIFGVPGYNTPLDDGLVRCVDDLDALEPAFASLIWDESAVSEARASADQFAEDFLADTDSGALARTIQKVQVIIERGLDRAAEPTAARRRELAHTLVRAGEDGEMLDCRIVALAVGGNASALNRDVLTWRVFGWLLAAGQSRGSGGLARELSAACARLPREWRPRRPTRLAVLAHLDSALAFEHRVSGRRLTCYRYRLHAWIRRSFGRAIALGDTWRTEDST